LFGTPLFFSVFQPWDSFSFCFGFSLPQLPVLLGQLGRDILGYWGDFFCEIFSSLFLGLYVFPSPSLIFKPSFPPDIAPIFFFFFLERFLSFECAFSFYLSRALFWRRFFFFIKSVKFFAEPAVFFPPGNPFFNFAFFPAPGTPLS